MIKHTRITATFGNSAEEGYNTNETYVFNLMMSGSNVILFPCDDTPVLSFDSTHEFVKAFKSIEF